MSCRDNLDSACELRSKMSFFRKSARRILQAASLLFVVFLFTACQDEALAKNIEKLRELQHCLEHNKYDTEILVQELELFVVNNEGYFTKNREKFESYRADKLERLATVKESEVNEIFERLYALNQEILNKLRSDPERLEQYAELMGRLR